MHLVYICVITFAMNIAIPTITAEIRFMQKKNGQIIPIENSETFISDSTLLNRDYTPNDNVRSISNTRSSSKKKFSFLLDSNGVEKRISNNGLRNSGRMQKTGENSNTREPDLVTNTDVQVLQSFVKKLKGTLISQEGVARFNNESSGVATTNEVGRNRSSAKSKDEKTHDNPVLPKTNQQQISEKAGKQIDPDSVPYSDRNSLKKGEINSRIGTNHFNDMSKSDTDALFSLVKEWKHLTTYKKNVNQTEIQNSRRPEHLLQHIMNGKPKEPNHTTNEYDNQNMGFNGNTPKNVPDLVVNGEETEENQPAIHVPTALANSNSLHDPTKELKVAVDRAIANTTQQLMTFIKLEKQLKLPHRSNRKSKNTDDVNVSYLMKIVNTMRKTKTSNGKEEDNKERSTGQKTGSNHSWRTNIKENDVKKPNIFFNGKVGQRLGKNNSQQQQKQQQNAAPEVQMQLHRNNEREMQHSTEQGYNQRSIDLQSRQEQRQNHETLEMIEQIKSQQQTYPEKQREQSKHKQQQHQHHRQREQDEYKKQQEQHKQQQQREQDENRQQQQLQQREQDVNKQQQQLQQSQQNETKQQQQLQQNKQDENKHQQQLQQREQNINKQQQQLQQSEQDENKQQQQQQQLQQSGQDENKQQQQLQQSEQNENMQQQQQHQLQQSGQDENKQQQQLQQSEQDENKQQQQQQQLQQSQQDENKQQQQLQQSKQDENKQQQQLQQSEQDENKQQQQLQQSQQDENKQQQQLQQSEHNENKQQLQQSQQDENKQQLQQSQQNENKQQQQQHKQDENKGQHQREQKENRQQEQMPQQQIQHDVATEQQQKELDVKETPNLQSPNHLSTDELGQDDVLKAARHFRLKTIKHLVASLTRDPFDTWIYHQKTFDELGITPSLIKSGIVNLGSSKPMQNIVRKAVRGKTIKMMVVGGSISAGGGLWKDRGNTDGVYHKALADWWKKTVTPITKSDMDVNNVAIGGTDSEYFSYCLKNFVKFNPDLVLWELSANDYNKYNERDFDPSRPLEQLTRLVLQLPSHPALIYVNFFRGDRQNFDLSEKCPDSEETEVEVLSRYYDIPSLSWRRMVCDLITTKRTFVNRELFGDDGYHPSLLGHAQVAMLLTMYVKGVFESVLADDLEKMEKFNDDDDDFDSQDSSVFQLKIPAFKDPLYPKPCCWTLLTPDYTTSYMNSLSDVNVLKGDGFELNNVTAWDVRTDRIQCLLATKPGARLDLSLNIPVLDDDKSLPISDAQTRTLAIATHNQYGGAADVQLDELPSRTSIVTESGRLKRSKVHIVSENVRPGVHNLRFLSLSSGFCITSIMVL